jgi:anthraniloyl-CoA monooxygenase
MSASPLPYHAFSPVPREMTRADMDAVIRDFVASVRRANAAGFDMIELHCAHGYLLASFISPLTNTRTDAYGGSLQNRMKFPLEVFRAVREAWPVDKPASVRISATDWKEGGTTSTESVEIARAFSREGADLVDASTGQTVPDGKPIYGRMFQTPFADAIRNEAKVRTMCVGAITSADQANTILAAGRADLVALGRPHLVDPFFTLRAAAWYGSDTVKVPPQYFPGRDQAFRNSLRERQELLDLRQRGRPKSRAELAIPRRSAAE